MTDRDDARSLPPRRGDEAGAPPPATVGAGVASASRRPARALRRTAPPAPGRAPGLEARPGRSPAVPRPARWQAPPRHWDEHARPGSSWGGGQVPPGYGQAPPGPGSRRATGSRRPVGPGYGQAPPGGYGYGPPPGFGRPAYAPPGPPQLRHRPGAGLVVGLVGLAMLVASLAGLPWISVGGEDATLRDIGDAYSALDGLDVGDGGIFTPPDVTVPDVSVPDVTLPDGSSPDDGLGPVVTPPGTVDDTYTPPPSGDLEPFHELYAKGLCWAVAAWAALALVAAALWVPPWQGRPDGARLRRRRPGRPGRQRPRRAGPRRAPGDRGVRGRRLPRGALGRRRWRCSARRAPPIRRSACGPVSRAS